MKLTQEELRQLIEEHNISFEGPIPPREWPERYRHTFEEIRGIENLRIEAATSRTDDDHAVAQVPAQWQLKRRAIWLSRVAWRCRRERANEAQWRHETEPVVLARFDLEVSW
jgi:hypothetical protein